MEIREAVKLLRGHADGAEANGIAGHADEAKRCLRAVAEKILAEFPAEVKDVPETSREGVG